MNLIENALTYRRPGVRPQVEFTPKTNTRAPGSAWLRSPA